MTNAHTAAATEAVTIGDFIEVPAWNVTGCIVDMRPATLGSDNAIEVRLQHTPHQSEHGWRWYRLEPTEYIAL
jgi:hypothetical protein